MLYQELPRIDSTPLDGWGRWIAPAIVGAAGLTAAVILLLAGHELFAAAAVAGAIAVGAAAYVQSGTTRTTLPEPLVGGPDYSLVSAALGLIRDPVGLSSFDGSLLVVNHAYRERFGTTPPLELAASDEARQGLNLAKSMAQRDGAGCVA